MRPTHIVTTAVLVVEIQFQVRFQAFDASKAVIRSQAGGFMPHLHTAISDYVTETHSSCEEADTVDEDERRRH